MEATQTGHRSTYVNLAENKSRRLPTRPLAATEAIRPGEGRVFEDHGSTLAPPSGSQTRSQRASQSITRRSRSMEISEDEDDDELDCLSQNSRGSPDTITKVNPRSENKQGALWKGEILPYAKGFEPKKLPSFTKTKSIGTTDPPLKPSTSKTSIAGRMQGRSPVPKPTITEKKVHAEESDNTPSTNPVRSRPKPKPKVKPFPDAALLGNASDAPESSQSRTRSQTAKSASSQSKNDPEATPRPKPRPVLRKAPDPPPFSAETPTGQEERILNPVSNKPLSRQNSARAKSDLTVKSKPAGFPDFSPPSAESKSKPTRTVQPFPDVSPPALNPAKPKRTAAAFPTLSPKAASGSKFRAARLIVESSDEESDTPSNSKAAPFPLSTQFFNSTDTPPSSKRSSADGDHDGGSARKKKKPDEQDQTYSMLDESLMMDESDLLFMDPDVDPSTLCPWCDEPLPPEPTAHLVSLMESVRKKSHREVRPRNPLGMKASVGTYITVCKRHRFESHQIPLAESKGWPTRIDFHGLKDRVEALREHMGALILNMPPSSGWDDLDEQRPLPRDGSKFWQELVGDLKAKGKTAMASAKGQFANFDKLQPGYYGELGYIIMHQTVLDLFPPSSIDPSSVAPLTAQEFTQRILIPEVAVELIMDDMSISRERAIETLRESVEYGVAMFPDTGEAGSVVDKMVKERASARRKELEEEGAWEDQSSKKRQGKKRANEDDRMSSAPSSSAPRSQRSSRTKPASKKKNDSDDEIEVGEIRTKPPQRPKPRKRTKNDDEYTTDASSSHVPSPKKRVVSRTRSKASDSEAVPSKPKTSKSKRALKDIPQKSDSDSDIVVSSPPRPKKLASQNRPHTWQQDHEETPRPKKTQAHTSLQDSEFRPMDLARKRRANQSDSEHIPTSSPEQNLAHLLGSEE